MSIVILKPDEIGDFVQATGAIRLLAQHFGEKNTSLAVKSEIAPLARREFPRADVIPLANLSRRKGRNSAHAFAGLFPAWRRLRRFHPEVVVCLRSRRNSSQTLLFAAPRAARHVAAENVLVREGGSRRKLMEYLLRKTVGPELLEYPSDRGDLTLELASHRSVVAKVLGREIATAEILPCIESVRWRGSGGWLLCPFSSRSMKDYGAELWLESLLGAKTSLPKVIRLAGGPDQKDRLQSFASVLRAGLPQCSVVVLPPKPLDNFPDLVADADLVLTVDTAAAHFACAINAPAVIVDSGNNPGVYGPYGRPERQVWLTGDRKKFGRLRWRESVPPGVVAAAIRRVLGS